MSNTSIHRTTILSSLGAGLEYYDFVIYAMLAGVISQLFFPAGHGSIALINTFAVFALGYIVRPIGGILFGAIGDRFGRKHSFVSAMVLMAAATFSIGLLPTYQQVGIAAPIALLTLRILQGISFGAELPGAITFICEHSHNSQRASKSSWVFFGVACGTTLASFVNYLLSSLLNQQVIHQFAWRLPFLFGGVLGFVAYALRRNTTETPMFQPDNVYASTSLLLRELISKHWRGLLSGTALVFAAGIFIIFYLFLASYLPKIMTLAKSEIMLAITLGMLTSAFFLPLAGYLADYIGALRLYAISLVLMVLLIPYVGLSLPSMGFYGLLLYLSLYQLLVASLAGCYPSLIAQAFPTPVRYTGVAVCYNLAFAMAGLTPVVASILLR